MSASVPERWLRMGALGQTGHPGELEWHMAELTLAPVLADLREQVQELEDPGCRRVVGGCRCRRSDALRDVLDLIEGGEQ